MRCLAASLAIACFLSGATAMSADQEFPYKAYVIREEVYVRSGPGDDYYPTDKLHLGQLVEVYRHDPGGWFAIRPPEGSFTWVSGRFLEPQRNHLAKVTAERVAARVGSKFSDIRDVIQVRLQKGEMVEIFDAASTSDAHGEKTVWYKIAPPSGEFRWVLGKYVDPDYPIHGVRKHTPVQPVSVSQEDPRDDDPSAAASGRRRAVAVPPADGATVIALPPTTPPAPPADAASSTRRLSPEEFQAELDAVDLKLSIMVAEETSVWTFDELTPRANALVEQAQSAVERGRARQLAGMIARFAEIKQRYVTVNSLLRRTDQKNGELAHLERQQAAATPTESPADRFDGTGKLARVKSTAIGAPRYALVEPNGQVRCYVSPAPGVELQSYVGRNVGVNGTRGYIPEQGTNHVMAKHVMILDDTLVR